MVNHNFTTNKMDSTNTTDYPKYDEDGGLFAKFLEEHTILVPETETPDDASNDDDHEMLFEPTVEGKLALRRVKCYGPHLQRIKNRQPYNSERTFLIEVPLSELVAWDAVNGLDLARRATDNAMRYQELFCKVIDSVLEQMQVTFTTSSQGNSGSGARDSIDVLLEQRRAQQDARREEQAAGNGDPDDLNGPLGGGGLENDQAVLAGTNNTGNNAGQSESSLAIDMHVI